MYRADAISPAYSDQDAVLTDTVQRRESAAPILVSKMLGSFFVAPAWGSASAGFRKADMGLFRAFNHPFFSG